MSPLKKPVRKAKPASRSPVRAPRRKASRRVSQPVRTRGAKGPRRKPVVVDVHAHIVVPEVLSFAYEHSLFAQAVAKGQGVPEPLMQRMTDMALRLRDMDATGVDIQVISPSILQQCTYWAPPEESLKMERLGNDRIAEAVARKPDRLAGLAGLPMQDVALAAGELERCVRDLGLKGAIISSHVNGAELGDARFRPFWAKAEELGAVIFIHPAGSADQRMRRNRLLITLGQPLEEAFAQSSLVYEGVMDAFPELKVMMAHGGGFLPFYAGRHDNDWRNGMHPQLESDFTSYFPRFYYDAVLFNPDMLEFCSPRCRRAG